MVRIAFKTVGYTHADFIIRQYPKILSLDPLKQRLLLPPAQGATAKSRIPHNDQALPTTTTQRSRMSGWQSETDILGMGIELKEMGRNVTRNWVQPRIDEVSRMMAISGPMPASREIQAMKTTSVRIKRMGTGTMTGIERADVIIERKEYLRTTGEK